MASGPRGRALPVLYLVPVTVACGLLALSGYVIDRLPLLPASVTRGYQRAMFATIFGLCRPVDAWTDRSPEAVAGGVAGESAP